MTALTKPRATLSRAGDQLHDPLKANTTIYAGALVVLDATGYAVSASTATGLKVRGVAQETVVNSGSNGARGIRVDKGTFLFNQDNSIKRTHIEGTAYIVDDNTVSATNGTNTRSAAGKIIDIDDSGVWVQII